MLLLSAYEYSPSDGTDGTLDDAEMTTADPSTRASAANKLRKKRFLRTSRKKHDTKPMEALDIAVPRNLSADAVCALFTSEFTREFYCVARLVAWLNGWGRLSIVPIFSCAPVCGSFVGKLSVMCQPAVPTQPSIPPVLVNE